MEPASAVITGGSRGLGREILAQEHYQPTRPGRWHNISYTGLFSPDAPWVTNHIADLRWAQEAQSAVQNILSTGEPVEVLVNNAGVNLMGSLDELTVNTWDHVMNVNARAMWYVTSRLLPALEEAAMAGRQPVVLNVVSNASHTPMTHSAAYNASKGAAHILTLQMARELRAKGIAVVGVSPNKMANTEMSEAIDSSVAALRGWTAQEVTDYQAAGLHWGEELAPADVARWIGYILSDRAHARALAGCVVPYGA